MASIQCRFFKTCNSLIVLLISLLGFSSSCKEEEARYEYGAPSNIYVLVKGKVQSAENNNPVPEIVIQVHQVKTPPEGPSYTQLWKTDFSDTNGDYRIGLSDNRTYQLRFMDTDGALNGEYETLDTTIVTNTVEFPKEIIGAEGLPEKEMIINLKPKK